MRWAIRDEENREIFEGFLLDKSQSSAFRHEGWWKEQRFSVRAPVPANCCEALLYVFKSAIAGLPLVSRRILGSDGILPILE